MTSSFLDKLAPEIREKIYTYVLDSKDTPLRHSTHLRPSMKNPIKRDSESWFSDDEPTARVPDLTLIRSFDEPLFDNASINIAILRISKAVYNEAIQVFYDLNTINIDAQLLQLEGIPAPLGSDLLLAKHLAFDPTSNGTSDQGLLSYHRGSKPLDLDNLFPRVQAMFPKLQTITIYTDGRSSPTTVLFNIGQDLSTSPFVKSVQFVSVGHIEAKSTLNPKLTITVKFKKLFDTRQGYAAMSQEALQATAAVILARKEQDFASHVYHLFATFRCLGLQDFMEEFVEMQAEPFHREMPETCPAFAQGGLWDYALWTWFAVPYGQECKV